MLFNSDFWRRFLIKNKYLLKSVLFKANSPTIYLVAKYPRTKIELIIFGLFSSPPCFTSNPSIRHLYFNSEIYPESIHFFPSPLSPPQLLLPSLLSFCLFTDFVRFRIKSKPLNMVYNALHNLSSLTFQPHFISVLLFIFLQASTWNYLFLAWLVLLDKYMGLDFSLWGVLPIFSTF